MLNSQNMMTVVPDLSSPLVTDLCNMIVPNGSPIYVPCRIETQAQKNDCFSVVQNKVESFGGNIQHGWQIWKMKEIMIEAEFHAVWVDSHGDYLDIAPKDIHVEKILFLPDANLIYEGRQVNNIRKNITGDQVVQDLIDLCDAKFRFENKGERAFQHEIILNDSEKRFYEKISDAFSFVGPMIAKGLKGNSPCPCNSRKKYKVCHGKAIRKIISKI